jgi:hypothetical protein
MQVLRYPESQQMIRFDQVKQSDASADASEDLAELLKLLRVAGCASSISTADHGQGVEAGTN